SATADWTEGADRSALRAPLVAEVTGDAGAVAAVPGVATADVRRTVPLRLGRAGRDDAEVLDVAAAAQTRGLRAVHGSVEALHGAAMAVTESYVTDIGGRVGDVRTLHVGDASTKVTIAAVVPDAPDLWADLLVPDDLPGVAGAARPVGTVFVVPDAGTDDRTVAAALRRTGADVATADAWVAGVVAETRATNAAVLWVMLGPAGVYAAIGAANAVLIGSGQRRRQLATARLLGATPAQVRRAAVWETSFTGVAALLLGGAVAGFVGWFVRQAVVREVPQAPLTVPWRRPPQAPVPPRASSSGPRSRRGRDLAPGLPRDDGEHGLDGLLEVQVAGVDRDDAVGGRVERRHLRVLPVAPQHLVARGVDRGGVGGAVHLQRPAAQPRLLRRGEQHADVGVGRHDRGDVAPFGDDPAAAGAHGVGRARLLVDDLPLPPLELGTHLEVRGDLRDVRRHVGAADRRGDVPPVQLDAGRRRVHAHDQRHRTHG